MMPTCTCRDAASACGACLALGSPGDPRAERAILDRAEAYRLVEEARQMREERDHWRTLAEQYIVERDAYRRTLADLLGMHPARIVSPAE
jgi:hypothetical protein